MSIREMRETLQGPRRPHDTLYGRWVMRTFSIYITAACTAMRIQPAFITALSLFAGVWGAWLIARSEWLPGLLFVNAWYLLDHVDGELARFYKTPSAAGLYFDTILNAIVPPLTFFALGASLATATGSSRWLIVGSAAAYGSLMLLILPFCEAAVVLQWSKGSSSSAASDPGTSNAPGRSVAGKAFAALHTLVTFPVFLPLVTAWVILTTWAEPLALAPRLGSALSGYAGLVSAVWMTILFHAVWTGKTEKALTRR